MLVVLDHQELGFSRSLRSLEKPNPTKKLASTERVQFQNLILSPCLSPFKRLKLNDEGQ